MNCISRRCATQHPAVDFARINIVATKISGFYLGTIELFSADCEPSKPIAINDSGTLQKYLQELVNQTGQRSIVLWLDDAHLLNTTTDDSLRMLQSRLEKVQIRLIIILVGLPGIRKLNERVSFSDGTATIIPAPPINDFELHGLRTALDVEYSLGAFDNTFYPSGTSWSFTRFFFPLAHLNGFRLKEHAEVLWRVFSEETRDRARTLTEVPILYFLRTVESALIDGAGRDCADFEIDQEFWRESVLRSGWVESQEREWALRELQGVEELG